MASNHREIVLDTETTGASVSSGHRIIDIGAVELIGKVPTGRKFSSYLNPKRDVSDGAYQVHGISTQFLQDKPLFGDIAQDLLQFIGDANLVIHNAPFDMSFLNNELMLIGYDQIPFDRAIDTLSIARKLYPGSKVSLDALCKRFKIDISHRSFHGALKDAELLVAVYIEMVGKEQTSLFVDDPQRDFVATPAKSAFAAAGSSTVIAPSNEEAERHKNLLRDITAPIWLS